MPTVNIWCTQMPKLTTPCRRSRRNCAVADQRPVGEDRDHRRQKACHRQEDDVDVWVAEQPEQMLPEQRIATPRRVEERQAKARSTSSRIAPSTSGGKATSIINLFVKSFTSIVGKFFTSSNFNLIKHTFLFSHL